MSRIPAFNSTWSAFSEHLPWHFFRSIAGLTCRLPGRRAGCGMTRPGHLARTCKRVGRTRRNGLCSRWPPGRLKRPAHHHGGPRYFTSVPAVALRTFRHRAAQLDGGPSPVDIRRCFDNDSQDLPCRSGYLPSRKTTCDDRCASDLQWRRNHAPGSARVGGGINVFFT